jgi:hypothetical protein
MPKLMLTDGTLALSWGSWGGFYVHSGFCKRLCLGWVAITFCPVEVDDLMDAYVATTTDAGTKRGSGIGR